MPAVEKEPFPGTEKSVLQSNIQGVFVTISEGPFVGPWIEKYLVFFILLMWK